MLFVKEDRTHIDGTVLVQSREHTEQSESTNEFILDYEDFILLRSYHFYYHANGNYICTFDKRQTYLNRILAWKRGFYDLHRRPKIVIKPENKDKNDFSKNNLVYYFTDKCKPFTGVEKLPRGVIVNEKYKYNVQVPVMFEDHSKSYLNPLAENFTSVTKARMMFIRIMKELKGDDYIKWI